MPSLGACRPCGLSRWLRRSCDNWCERDRSALRLGPNFYYIGPNTASFRSFGSVASVFDSVNIIVNGSANWLATFCKRSGWKPSGPDDLSGFNVCNFFLTISSVNFKFSTAWGRKSTISPHKPSSSTVKTRHLQTASRGPQLFPMRICNIKEKAVP